MKFLTVAQAAESLSVHEDTVRRLIDRGELRAARIGRAVRIDESDLQGLVRRRTGVDAVKTITPGQLRALHAKAGDIDVAREVPRGTSKKEAMRDASAKFGRQLESANDLDEIQASWVLDQLERTLDAIRA